MANNLAKIDKISAAALDFDGVITSLDIDWKAAILNASAIAGYDVNSLLLFYDEQFGKPLFEKVSKAMEKLELEAINRAQLLPYVKEALDHMTEKGIDLYIVSMQTTRVINDFLLKHGLLSYFKDIVTREKIPSKKAQVTYVLKNHKIPPNQLMLIDDSIKNINTCSQLGIICIHFQAKAGLLYKHAKAKEEWIKLLANL
jgi:HAD superfamily hydrolase (TIGR01509 family)